VIIMNTLKTLIVALVLLILSASGLQAQTALTTTTLNTALTDTSGTLVSVASATGITAPGVGAGLTYLYIDNEAMSVRAVSGTNITVSRGQTGTRANTHAANQVIYVIPAVAAQTNLTTVDFGGSCTATSYQYLPIINVKTGNIWNCVATTSGTMWQGWNSIPLQETKPRTVVTAQAYTVLPTDYLIVISTISAGVSTRSITLPSHVGLAGKQILVKDESGGITATTSIVLIGTIDGTSSAVTTVIQLKTAFGMWFGYAGSGGWFTLTCGNGGGAVTSACR
jgi:hypothetical protein